MGCMNKVFRGEIDRELFDQAERTRHGFGGVKMTGMPLPAVPRLGGARLRRLHRGLRLREPRLLHEAERADAATPRSTCATTSSAAMDFRLLGPLEVFEDNRSLALGGVKQRSVLAVLLMHANELVTADQLIDEIWGGTPPAKAAKNIQVQVSRLRKVLDSGRVTTGPGGYVLHLEPHESDVARFERLAAEAAGAPPQRAADKLREALGAVARARARRSRLRGICPARDRASRGDAPRGACAANRRRPGARTPRGARRRARGAGRTAPAPGAPAIPADARPLPLGTSGRGARGLPRGAARALGGAWPGAERAAQAARAGDPAPGPEPRSGGERRGPGAAQARGHGRPRGPRRPQCHGCARRPDRDDEVAGVGRSRARADRGRGRGGGRAPGRDGGARTAQGGAPGAGHRRQDGSVLVAYPRCGHHSARRAGGRRPAGHRLPGRGARPGDSGGARARAVRRRPAGAGGRIRTRGAGGRALRRRRPRLGGACARSVGRARQGRSASADRHGIRR